MISTHKLKELHNILNKHDSFIIVSHINPDGDAIGAQLAFATYLSSIGKESIMVNATLIPDMYSFVEGIDKINFFGELDKKSLDEIKHIAKNSTCAIVVDCSEKSRIGEAVFNIISEKFIVIIDHHKSPVDIGEFTIIDEEASSIGEILYLYFKENNIAISRELAYYIYLSIVTDTGSFKFVNTTSLVHRIAAELIDIGVNVDYFTHKLYYNKPYSAIKLLGNAMARVEMDKNSKIGWTYLTKEDFKTTGAKRSDTEGIVEFVKSIREINIAILFCEESDSIKVSMRSKNAFDISMFALKYGGGGHKRAAGFSVYNSDIKNTIRNVIKNLKNELIKEGHK